MTTESRLPSALPASRAPHPLASSRPMAARLRPGMPLLLVRLLDAPPPAPAPSRPRPSPPPFPREGPGIGAAPPGLRLDSQSPAPGAPYKGMVGTECGAGVGGPAPGAASGEGCGTPPLCRITSAGRGLTSSGAGACCAEGAAGLLAPPQLSFHKIPSKHSFGFLSVTHGNVFINIQTTEVCRET